MNHIVQYRKPGLKSQAGFTLVELAIVMIIIGLLIGGVLKGQELITNAQITATVAQVKSIDGATTTFKDMYNALPGDMLNPAGRLPNCAPPLCSLPGDGNGSLANLPGATPIGGEGERFFVHLAAANLVTGINPGGGNATWGNVFPATKVSGGGIEPGSDITGAAADFPAVIDATSIGTGLYLTLLSVPGAPAAATVFMTPNQAFRIDQKLDDGVPGAGSVRAFGGVGVAAGNCGSATATGIYNEKDAGKDCGLYIRIQG